MRSNHRILPIVCALAATKLALAQDQSASELAKKVQNPIASMISLPILALAAFVYGAAMTLYPVKLAAEGLRVDDRGERRQKRF